jgi:osmoprotectant transport system permease protein
MAGMNLWQQLITYFMQNGMYVLQQFGRHFLISIYGVLLAAIVGIPLGIFISRYRKLSSTVVGLANVIQTIPSLAMLSILMLGLGLGVNTVIVTVFLYSLLPILKNTYTGMQNVNKDVIDAGKGIGMTSWQRLYYVELPLIDVGDHGWLTKRLGPGNWDYGDWLVRGCWRSG